MQEEVFSSTLSGRYAAHNKTFNCDQLDLSATE